MSNRWEYRWVSAYRQSSVDDAAQAMQQIVKRLGQEGWEMVSFAFQANSNAAGTPQSYDAVSYMKRPV